MRFFVFEKGNLDVLDGAFVIVDKTAVRTHIPIDGVACLILEPGIRVSHATVTLAARVGCLLIWVGEAGARLYALESLVEKLYKSSCVLKNEKINV